MTNIGFTGTQRGMTDFQLTLLMEILKRLENFRGRLAFHHGDCIGADAQAATVAAICGCELIGHPPEIFDKRAHHPHTRIWEEPAAYLDRNRAIVNASEFLIAAPKGFHEEIRSGTWATIRYAHKQTVPVLFLEPSALFPPLLR